MNSVPPPDGQSGPFPGGAPGLPGLPSGAAYRSVTRDPLIYFPVMLDGDHVGYLWAGLHDNAAQFLPRDDAAAMGNAAMSPWIVRLCELHAGGVPAIEALERCRAFPADPTAGQVRPDAPAQESASLDDLRRHASVYGQSLRFSENPVPGAPDVARRPALDPQERDAVLNYLRQGLAVYDSGRFFADGFDPARPQRVPDSYHTDGTWVWRGGTVHHLDHHGIPPEPGLLRHIRDNQFRLPPLGPDDRERGKQTLRLHRLLVPPPRPPF